MNSWFLVRINYTAEKDNGSFGKSNENYLIRTDCYCGAENRMKTEAEEFVRGGLKIRSVRELDIADVYEYSDSCIWYLVTVRVITVDPDTEKSKGLNQQYLVTAGSIKQAHERIEEQLVSCPEFEIRKAKDSLISEVYWSTEEELDKQRIEREQTH